MWFLSDNGNGNVLKNVVENFLELEANLELMFCFGCYEGKY